MKGKSYSQGNTKKKVTFTDEVMSELEYCHNLISQVHLNPEDDVEYVTSHAMLVARVMDDIGDKSATDIGMKQFCLCSWSISLVDAW